MTTPIKVRVAGEEYEVSAVNELALFPLLRVFGTDIAPTDQHSKEYKKWQQKFLGRFADPTNQASVAYSLRTIIPDLPESVVKYVLYKEESGDRREDFVLNIGAMDLLALITAISPLLLAGGLGLAAVDCGGLREAPVARMLGLHPSDAVLAAVAVGTPPA